MLQYSVGFFYSCLHHSNLADEMFYKQNDIEPVPVGCQEMLPSGINLIKSSNSATNFTESTTFHSIKLLLCLFTQQCHSLCLPLQLCNKYTLFDCFQKCSFAFYKSETIGLLSSVCKIAHFNVINTFENIIICILLLCYV